MRILDTGKAVGTIALESAMKRLLSNLLFVIGLAAVVGVVFWLRRERSGGEGPAPRPPYQLPVTLGEVIAARIVPRVRLTGSVLPGQYSLVGFEVAGRLARITFEEGDAVKAGQVLATLDDSDQLARLERARAGAALAQKELERLLAGSREETVRRLQASLDAAKAEAVLAAKEVVRGRELLDGRIINPSQFDALVAADAAAAAGVEAAAETLAEAEAGTRAEEIAVQRAQVEVQDTEVSLAQTELAKTQLSAPYDANVVRRNASLGDVLSAGQGVCELVHSTERSIAVEIPSRWVGQLTREPKALITIDEDPRFRLLTPLDSVVQAADLESRNFRGLARLSADEDPALQLKPGMFVRVELELDPIEDAYVVPSDALRSVPQGTIVVRAAPTAPTNADAGPPGESGGLGPPPAAYLAEWVAVRILGSDETNTAVAPLDPEAQLGFGDRLVLTGVDLAYPGTPLMVRPDGPPPSAGPDDGELGP
jgi:HlyD family secretion protein